MEPNGFRNEKKNSSELIYKKKELKKEFQNETTTVYTKEVKKESKEFAFLMYPRLLIIGASVFYYSPLYPQVQTIPGTRY